MLEMRPAKLLVSVIARVQLDCDTVPSISNTQLDQTTPGSSSINGNVIDDAGVSTLELFLAVESHVVEAAGRVGFGVFVVSAAMGPTGGRWALDVDTKAQAAKTRIAARQVTLMGYLL